MRNVEAAVDTGGTPLVLVEPNSLEWDAVSAFLGLCARSSKVQLTSVWRISNANISFDRRRADKLTVPCWLPVGELGPHNRKSDVCRRGFVIGDDGLSIQFGEILLPAFQAKHSSSHDTFIEWIENSENQADKTTHDLFLCDVCKCAKISTTLPVGVGVPYSVDSWMEAKYIKRSSLPRDYDSVLITDNHKPELGDGSTMISGITRRIVDTTAALGSSKRDDTSCAEKLRNHLLPSSLEKSIGIRLFDSTQISPHFICTVDVYPDLHESFGIPLCAHCQEKAADAYCVADDTRLCANCNEFLHADNPILSRHLRVPLNQAPPEEMGKCDLHRQEECVYYCLVCECPICVLCKNAHLHGRRIEGGEPFVPILDAYHGILADYTREKTMDQEQGLSETPFVGEAAKTLRKRKAALTERIKKIDSLITECDAAANEAKVATHRIVQGAVDQLMYWCERNVADSLGIRFVQTRTLLELERGAAFIQYLKSVLPPPDFLQHWLHYCKQVKQTMVNSEDLIRKDEGVLPPLLKLEGTIVIDTD